MATMEKSCKQKTKTRRITYESPNIAEEHDVGYKFAKSDMATMDKSRQQKTKTRGITDESLNIAEEHDVGYKFAKSDMATMDKSRQQKTKTRGITDESLNIAEEYDVGYKFAKSDMATMEKSRQQKTKTRGIIDESLNIAEEYDVGYKFAKSDMATMEKSRQQKTKTRGIIDESLNIAEEHDVGYKFAKSDMATMEKSRQQKTKKTKTRRITDESLNIAEEHDVEYKFTKTKKEDAEDNKGSLPSLLDFVQLSYSSSKCEELISRECNVSDEYKTADFNSADNAKEIDIENKTDVLEECHLEETASLETECANNSSVHEVICNSPKPWTSNFEVPSAPSAPESSSTTPLNFKLATTIVTLPKYPNLSSVNFVETKSDILFTTKYQRQQTATVGSRLKHFTAEQMKEIFDCPFIELIKQHELEFLMNSLLETYHSDPLFILLTEYYNLLSKLVVNLSDIEKHRKQSQQIQNDIWIEVPKTVTFSGRCGDGSLVKTVETYKVAEISGKNLELAASELNQIFDLVCYTYTTNHINSTITKIKIEQIINEIVSYPSAMSYASNQTLLTLNKSLDGEIIQCMNHLRRAISILFSFIRKPCPNKTFDHEIKEWLTKLVSLHIRLATKEDHWFLLFHILRCPSGIGNWAASFLQLPFSCLNSCATSIGSRPSEIPLPLTSPEINHCIAVLYILLQPIKKRNEFLNAFTKSHKEISDPVKEDMWILIDSDGEDCHTSEGECAGLKESDLIALIDQIPFDKIFSSAMGVETFPNDFIIEADIISANQVIKVISFSSKLVELVGEGMLTYNKERYKQFAKRLGRLLRHILQYVSDYHEIFIRNNLSKDPYMCERIVVELNSLLIRSCSYIYRTRNLATWQYFSSLPYSSLDSTTVWQLFYYLNVGFPLEFPAPHEDYIECFHGSELWTNFNIAIAESSAEDLYYLLQAFFEMANERDRVKDWHLITTICLHIFNIGFINKQTRDVCYKTSRDMLVNLTLAYEELMTCLLQQLKTRFYEIENPAYLFKSLPLENWKPAQESFEVLSNWLLFYGYGSQENILARVIISHLNWNFDCDGRLFLQHNIHVRMACLICEAVTKHAPEITGFSGISESVRQVSGLVDHTQSSKENFTLWCWNMISVLRLHLMDQSLETIRTTLIAPTESLMFIPDLERIEIIYQGVAEKRPLAHYVSILVSLWGHSIPLICQKGFVQMKQLLNDYRHAEVIRCIELIMPLFLESAETLSYCENFHSILISLMNSDKTYLKMAKDMIYSNTIGPVLELLENMIQNQIINYTYYGLQSPLGFVNLWLQCLTNIPNWQNTNAVYFLDKILKNAYQYPDLRAICIEYFRFYYKDCDEWKGNKKLSTLKMLLGSNQTKIPTISATYGWLALVLLEIEFKTQEEPRIWPELLRQLASSSDGKISLDTILKKTASVVKMPYFNPHMLVIYKYANLISTIDVKDPVFPLIVQQFFQLYLARVPLTYDEEKFQHTYGVSDKFYEFDVPLMKKIKMNLKSAENFCSQEITKTIYDESLSSFYLHCSKMMKTYSLWLEETSINKLPKDQLNFPSQFNTEKLKEILNANTVRIKVTEATLIERPACLKKQHWTEFLHLPMIRKAQKNQADQWVRKCLRTNSKKGLRNSLRPKPHTTPIIRIKNHLRSYDKGLEPPKWISPKVNISPDIKNCTIANMWEKLQILSNVAKKFYFETSELSSINNAFKDIITRLYKNVPFEEVKLKSCNVLILNYKCVSPARIVCNLEHIKKDEVIERRIRGYREKHDHIIDSMLKKDVIEFAENNEQLRIQIRHLIFDLTAPSNLRKINNKIGINLFFTIAENMNEIVMKFQPTNECFSQMLMELGVFIQDAQESVGLRVLNFALKRPDLLKFLSGVLVPSRTNPEYFISMYKFLVDSHMKQHDAKILFVLLSKFDLALWLEKFHPKLTEINQLVKLIIFGLECWNQVDSNILQDLFRRHLVHIFEYDFPEHYGEIMQLVLDRISEQKLMAVVLLDLLNALLLRYNCEAIDLKTSSEKIKKTSIDFARRQTLFSIRGATDTVMLFARHFERERLHHGLHGLYPKHHTYCQPLSAWFSCFGHIVVITSICSYQDLLADQISDYIFSTIIEMYSPWLIIYTSQTTKEPAANWIRQLTLNGKVLYPWSASHANTSKLVIQSFIDTISFVLENLPVSQIILGHIFAWYIHHFAVENIEQHVQAPIHDGMAQLPWQLFKPLPNYIDLLYNSLQQFIPESHALLGHIYIRVDWNSWISEILPTWQSKLQSHIMSRLLTIFVKISFEPNIHSHPNTNKILEDAIKFPWHLVDYEELEYLFKWFVTSVEPAILLKMPSESNYADRAVLDLLQISCGMLVGHSVGGSTSNLSAKRILYVRSYVRLLRMCAAKHQKLMATRDGSKAFNTAIIDLLNNIDKSIGEKTIEEQEYEAVNLMMEIIAPMQTQIEETSNQFIDIIIDWQSKCNPGNILMCKTINAIGYSKSFIASIYPLIETTIANYFRTSETRASHVPSWNALLKSMQMCFDKFDLMPILQGPYFFILHTFILYKSEKLLNLGEQITFLQDIIQLLETVKTTNTTEPRMAIVWGVIISRGCKILSDSENAKKLLLMLARYFQVLSTQAEGWGDGLLGVIGLKKDGISNKRKALTRCLSCIIFALFPDTSSNSPQPNEEFTRNLNEITMLLTNKKFADIKPLIVKAIALINENKFIAIKDVPHMTSRAIAIFYNDTFLTTIPEVWEVDYKFLS